MQVLEVQQGSADWHQARARHFTASEAPAMMGASKYTTRADLLRQKHTGIATEVDAATQRRFDSGHAAEAAARAVVQKILGEDLYPVTGTLEVDGLPLLASFDGLTITDDLVWETKLLSNNLLSQVQAGELEPHYYWQLEQQLLVSGAEKAYFTTSDGTDEGTHGLYYESRPERRAALLAGWKQFAEDLKAYTPPAATTVVVAEAVKGLPAVAVQVSGEIVVKDNFPAFEVALRDFLDHRLIREPKTDQDFATLENQIKSMKQAEAMLDAAESQMLAQVQSIDERKKAKDMLAKLVRDNRLMAEKLLASEKERRKGEIVAGGVAALKAHVDGLNKRLGATYVAGLFADFGAAIKGMRSLASMEDAVATTLANAKIAANEIADRVDVNLKWLAKNAADYAGLFADRMQLVLKAHDDFVAQAQLRITNEQQRVQKEHDRIREEAAAKERQRLIDEQAAIQAKAATSVQVAPQTLVPPAAPIAVHPFPPTPVVAQKPAAVIDNAARIKLGQINERIAPLSITAAGLVELGFQPAGKEGAATMYRESDYPRICEALIQHLTQVADLQVA